MLPENKIIAIKAAVNSKYISAENAGSLPLIANRDAILDWETFEISFYEQGKVALRSMRNFKYVSAEKASSPLVAKKNKVGPSELF